MHVHRERASPPLFCLCGSASFIDAFCVTYVEPYCDLLCLASSRGIMLSGTAHPVACVSAALLFVAGEYPVVGCAAFRVSLYSLTDVWAAASSAAVKGVRTRRGPVLRPSGTVPQSGRAGAYGRSVFNFLRKLRTVFFPHLTFINRKSCACL